jgi:hypothetical protein
MKQAESREALFTRADEALARVSERITSADEQFACVRENVSKFERGTRHLPSDPQILVNKFALPFGATGPC